MTQQAGIARTDADYRRIGIRPDVVAEWEDGARTDGRRGTYEWWYLDDGATLVVRPSRRSPRRRSGS
ncbi:hypothetical protein SAMN05216276_110115 [Streptosporangium subroseum]|uniref:Uncharacterized protein n=1 Tax=Streptosporangium subroseum TaxID=106412 RepID=A0A239P946_9ACTN|nr:hypothetical protein [Streptosporangium subroseum]SNT63462.1 hypothetical protein SAMN05216276_110115 [Streptosporangium subroseum]